MITLPISIHRPVIIRSLLFPIPVHRSIHSYTTSSSTQHVRYSRLLFPPLSVPSPSLLHSLSQTTPRIPIWQIVATVCSNKQLLSLSQLRHHHHQTTKGGGGGEDSHSIPDYPRVHLQNSVWLYSVSLVIQWGQSILHSHHESPSNRHWNTNCMYSPGSKYQKWKQ